MFYQQQTQQHSTNNNQINDSVNIDTLKDLILCFQTKVNQLTQENNKLKSENAQFTRTIDMMENRQDELVNENQDLRTLIKRVYEEEEIQMDYFRQLNLEKQEKYEVLVQEIQNLKKEIHKQENNIQQEEKNNEK